jgi:hypothetical protein
VVIVLKIKKNIYIFLSNPILCGLQEIVLWSKLMSISTHRRIRDKVFLQTGLEEFPSTLSIKVTCVPFLITCEMHMSF